MGLFNKERNDGYTYDGQGEERKGLIDVVKYNGEPDELVWKFPYENLSIGTQLIVNQSQEALFYKGGAVCDIFGPGTHTISTNNIPILQKLVNLPFGGKTPFTAEVWFVNKIVYRNLKFGTIVPIDLLDPLYNVSVPVRSFGEYGIQINDSSAFITQMVGTLHLTTTELIIDQFKSFITRKLSTCISKYILQKEITVVKIGAYLDEISIFVRDAINEEFAQYGIRIVNLDVASINFDKDDPNIKKILDSQSEASKRRMEGYTYQQERQLDIMESAAGNEGGAGQMMGAGMGLGMGFGIGGSFGQQMSNMSNVMNEKTASTPPPPPNIPIVAFHILINNEQKGPFDMNQISQLIQQGQLNRETYVWKEGMAQWAKAGECTELQRLFGSVPPPPPMV